MLSPGNNWHRGGQEIEQSPHVLIDACYCAFFFKAGLFDECVFRVRFNCFKIERKSPIALATYAIMLDRRRFEDCEIENNSRFFIL